ncbi:hypothetical protein VT84_08125 [Gemmata sp. SH-PL17]|uniref:DUF2752 domain-containing protein n=1 Tax=Gemmata sp. SH-PL17 TaxID=1630693 RepID=UPI0004B77BE1|nr:DUF2752 domain-containing protein [Gemmata sp. SH-PL17]AMV24348.1 hypothetical protein VT84_08125 [Gemmata sp. SH-PL17]
MHPEQPDTNTRDERPPRAKVLRPAEDAARLKRVVRAALLSLAAALTAVFAAAAYIHPYDEDGAPRTMSTHTQLGMPPCNFAVLTGKPCPSCGMTTSFALLVHGDVSASLRANWVGTTICVIWALTLVWALASGLRGQPLFVPKRRGAGELIFTCVTGAVVFLMLARWGVLLIWG